MAAEGEGDEVSAPLVFLCASCRRIVGDTFAWVSSEQALNAVVLTGEGAAMAPREGRTGLHNACTRAVYNFAYFRTTVKTFFRHRTRDGRWHWAQHVANRPRHGQVRMSSKATNWITVTLMPILPNLLFPFFHLFFF